MENYKRDECANFYIFLYRLVTIFYGLSLPSWFHNFAKTRNKLPTNFKKITF